MSTRPHAAGAASPARWHSMIASGDLSAVPSLVRADTVLRSPTAHEPDPGRDAVVFILRTVFTVFEKFTDHRQLSSDDGLDVVLEFSAEVDGRQLKGIDLIRFDDEGQIVDFEVMVRPMSGLAALGEAMSRRVADVLPTLQGGAGGPDA